MLQRVHTSHQGPDACMRRATDVIFWPGMAKEIRHMISDTVVSLTEAHFACYGITETVITDNGPQFRSKTYEDFAKKWEFNHVTTSPYHSQSNGKAETAVKIAK